MYFQEATFITEREDPADRQSENYPSRTRSKLEKIKKKNFVKQDIVF
jgi:hypothetical protein